jgi:hypothetical protein
MSGTMDLVVAGGVQNMSMIPISSAMTAGQALGFDDPFTGSPGWTTRGTGTVVVPASGWPSLESCCVVTVLRCRWRTPLLAFAPS